MEPMRHSARALPALASMSKFRSAGSPLQILICLLGAGACAAAPIPNNITDFAALEKYAGDLARHPYEAPSQQLDPFFGGLKYDDHRMIRFRPEKALFGGDRDRFSVQFFHPGWMFKKAVGFEVIQNGASAPVPFDSALFEYGQLKLPETLKSPDGYAGFRILAPESLLGRLYEFSVFMGASYFRAVPSDLNFGLSARGVAINTIGGEPEEFPDFTHFWLEEPKSGASSFRFLALLNGTSVTGAYQFTITPGKVVDTVVKATLFLRRPVKMLGIAPFSSMYWFGENSHPKPYDFRPEVHDSDGLQIEVENGPTIWRPLDVGKDLRLSLFGVDRLKGFGLAERDRDFNNFQDLEANYHRRPAVWVEPIRGFGKGSVVLVELSTGEETWDNIVTMWQPAEVPGTPDQPLSFEYRLTWLEEHLPGLLCKVTATRRGFVMDSDEHLYVIDFTKGATNLGNPKPEGWVPEIDVLVSGGEAKVLDKRVMHNSATGGWRAFFKLDVPPASKVLELMCELKDGTKVISERWMYQWRS